MSRPPRKLTYNGETKSISEWAYQYGITTCTIYVRLREGLSEEEAITKPATRQSQKLNAWETKTRHNMTYTDHLNKNNLTK